MQNPEAHRLAFIAKMTPMAKWAASVNARPHPYFGPDDLFQEAMMALLDVWQRCYPTLDEEELRRVGRQAIINRFRNVGRRARKSPGGDGLPVISFDALLSEEDSLCLSDLEGDPNGDDSSGLAVRLHELQRLLTARGRMVLKELIKPSARTLAAIRLYRRAKAGQYGNWWAQARVPVLAAGTGLSPDEVRYELGAIKIRADEVFSGVDVSLVVKRVPQRSNSQPEVESMAPKSKAHIPDDADLSSVPSAEEELQEVEAGAETGKADPPGETEAGAKPKKPKKEKAVTTSKSEKKAAKAPKAAPAKVEKKAAAPRNGDGGAVAGASTVVAGDVEPRKDSFREQIKNLAKKPIGVTQLLAKLGDSVKNPRGKIKVMLEKGMLKKA